MEMITVPNKKFFKALKAFSMLYDREPIIYTCSRFTDEKGECVFGSCKVISIGKTKIVFTADSNSYKAHVKDVEYFTFC